MQNIRYNLAFSTTVIFLFAFTQLLHGDVKSLSGQLNFDVNSDSQPEMRLSGNRLGIGTLTPSANLHVEGNAIMSQLTIGSINNSSSNLHIQGSLSFSNQSVTNDHLAENSSYILADTSNDNILLTLPYAGNVTGRILNVKKTSRSNTLWVRANGGSIDQSHSTVEITADQSNLASLKLISDGTQWYFLRANGFSGNQILNTDMYAWYSFNTDSGTTLGDISESGHTGTLVSPGGNSTFGEDEGIIGKGISFNGVDEYVQVTAGTGSDFDTPGQNFSVSIWFKAYNAGRIFHVGAESLSSDHYTAYIESSGNLIFSWTPGGTSNDPYEVTGNYMDGQWHHIVGLRNGARTGQFWVNGVLEVDDTDNSGTLSGINISNDFYLGRSTGGNDYLNGSVDELRLFNYTLSEDEIQLLYFPH